MQLCLSRTVATHTLHQEKEIFYFVTFTCYNLVPLREKSDIHIFLPSWISEINKRGVLTCGYVCQITCIFLSMYKNSQKGLNPNSVIELRYERLKGNKTTTYGGEA